MSDKPYFTIEEVISIPYLSSPAVSEDGKQLAWVETAPNWDKNEYSKRVQVYNLKTGRTSAICDHSVSPAWSVKGQLAWLSSVGKDEDKVNQIFVLDQGQPIQVTTIPTGVTSFLWAPRGDGLYFLAPDWERKEELNKRKEKYGDLEFFNRDLI